MDSFGFLGFFQGVNLALVKFKTELGDLPDMYPTLKGVNTISIISDGSGLSVKGTKKNYQCSNRGTCDSTTGLCTCFNGYSSSDGNGGQGNRGDCGYVEKQAGYVTAA